MNISKFILFVGVFLLIPFQFSYANSDSNNDVQSAQATSADTETVDLANSFTVNVPNSQGGYTAIIITKSGNGYKGPHGKQFSEFPRVAQLQAVYGTGTSNLTVAANTNSEPQAQIESYQKPIPTETSTNSPTTNDKANKNEKGTMWRWIISIILAICLFILYIRREIFAGHKTIFVAGVVILLGFLIFNFHKQLAILEN